MTGACKPGERKKSSSKPLALAQFMSAFFLLGCGVCLSILFLIMEHLYFKYLRRWAAGLWGDSKWCGLVSLSMADSFQRAGTQTKKPKCKCTNAICDNLLEKSETELKKAKEQIRILEE